VPQALKVRRSFLPLSSARDAVNYHSKITAMLHKEISCNLNRDLSILRKKMPGFPISYLENNLMLLMIIKFPLQALVMGRQLKGDTHYSMLANRIEESLKFSPDINN
jgi:hypothetical protein